MELNISDYRDFLRGEFQVSKALFYRCEFEKLIDRYAFDGLELGQSSSGSTQILKVEQMFRYSVSLQIRKRYLSNMNSPRTPKRTGGYVVDGVGSLEATDGLFNQVDLH